MALRKDRWLRLSEVIALLVERYPDLLKLQPPEQRQKVRRIIRRAERRDGERYAKLVPGPGGRELVVSRNGLESLLPYDARTISNLEQAVAENAQNTRALKRQVNGLGARVRKIESRQELADNYLEGMAKLDASEARQKRVSERPLSG